MAKRKRTVDDRKILQGVQYHEDGVLVTVTDPDELETRMTAEQCEDWQDRGVIAGEAWEPKAKEATVVMRGSRMDRAQQMGDQAVKNLQAEEKARAERRKRREELAAQQRAEREGAEPAPSAKEKRAAAKAAREAEAARAEQETAQPPAE